MSARPPWYLDYEDFNNEAEEAITDLIFEEIASQTDG